MTQQFKLLLLLLVLSIGSTRAQDTKLFRFSVINNANERVALHHNLENNTAEFVPLSNETFNSTDGYLQAFIVSNTKDGKVRIASAKKNNYFLRVQEQTTSFIFSEFDENLSDEFDFQLVYAGAQHVAIMYLQFSMIGCNYNSEPELMHGRDTSNALLSKGEIGGLILHKSQRFKMETINNVF